jgi:hypothetical protein
MVLYGLRRARRSLPVGVPGPLVLGLSVAHSPLVALANEQVSIMEVCRQVGLEVPDEVVLGRASLKLYCPLADIEHKDGGRESSFRIYADTNTAYCFYCQRLFTPVFLYSLYHGVPSKRAAEALLESINYRHPVLEFKQDLLSTIEKAPDCDSLREALQLYCGRICPDWEIRQFDSKVSNLFSRCLGLLSKVKTESEAKLWLTSTKIVMHKILNDQEN